MEKKKEKVDLNKVDIILGALGAIGSSKLVHSLIKATVETKNPLVGLGLITIEVYAAVKGFCSVAYMSNNTRDLVRQAKEVIDDARNDQEEEVTDDE